MNWLDGFNKVVAYIEAHLEEEMDYDKIADIFGYSSYHFQRLFMLISGVSLAEYVRSRRLSKAAEDLLDPNTKVIDIAYKYGYSSPNSFNRAFKAMHGVSAKDVKKQETTIKAFPPLSFELTIKGADAMDYRIQELPSFRIVGKKIHSTMLNGQCYREVPAFWSEQMQSGAIQEVLSLMNEQPMGLLGIGDYNPDLDTSEFDYYIAVSTNKEIPEGMDELMIPASTWAVFPHPSTESESAQKFQQRIVMEWLPSSGYEFSKAPDVETYDAEGNMETWIPVIKTK